MQNPVPVEMQLLLDMFNIKLAHVCKYQSVEAICLILGLNSNSVQLCSGPSRYDLLRTDANQWYLLASETEDHLGSSKPDWLHDIAHVALICDAFPSPEGFPEIGILMGWERQVARWFVKTGYWSMPDYQTMLRMQGCYGIGLDKLHCAITWADLDVFQRRNHVRRLDRLLALGKFFAPDGSPQTPTWSNKLVDRIMQNENMKFG